MASFIARPDPRHGRRKGPDVILRPVKPAFNKALAAAAFLALAAASSHAGTIEVTARDAKGAMLEDAVVWAMPKAGGAPARKRDAEIEQKDRQFMPLVTAVQVGTSINFPNRDTIRHHVYSFSAPKPFEIKLYVGTPAAPVVFDKPGEVVLGCNIHDHMLAYVYVVETPWFAKTGADGNARIEGLPAGEYDVRVWHYAQSAPIAPYVLRVPAEGPAPVGFAVALKALPPRAAPK